MKLNTLNSIKITFFSVLIIFFMTGCVFSPVAIYNNDKEIARDTNFYNKISFNCNHSEDGKMCEFSCKEFSGLDELAKIDAKDDCDAEVLLSVDVNYGKIKLVLVTPNSNVITLKEVISDNCIEEKLNFHCEKGISKIKIVGDDFEGKLKIIQRENLLDFIQQKTCSVRAAYLI